MMYHSDISTKKKMYHSHTYLRNNILEHLQQMLYLYFLEIKCYYFSLQQPI